MPTADTAQNRGTSLGAAVPVFHHLPAYARFLLDHSLAEFAASLLKISVELQIPLLRYLDGIPEEQLIALGISGNKLLLEAIAENRVDIYIEESLRNWKENQLPLIQSDDIVIEDISKVNFSRRKAFRDFLPRYTSELATYIAVMEEVDRFTLLQEEVSYKTLFEIKERKIREHHYFIDKINNASPGIIYVYDLLSHRQIYTNHRREELLGYSDEEMARLDGNLTTELVHPDDRQSVARHQQHLSTAADSELYTVEFRIRDKAGKYVWLRAYETVFRRGADDAPVEIIGISIDISQEKESSIRLEQREQQLREAQEIAGMGSFEWDLRGNESVFSPYLLHIFELEERGNLPEFLEHVHPSDRESVKQAIADALTDKKAYECEYRYRKRGPEKVIWSRGRVVFQDGKAVKMKGTVMDVTQRHDMLKRLARSEELHKQAQALTRLGNWSWSLADSRAEWSDEMYRIFGLPPQSEAMTLGRILTFIHPDDREDRRMALHNALSTRHADDYTMRVLAEDGSIKYVEGKSEVLCDENGPYKIVGTCQDITNNYLLNERLKENEEASRQLINNAPEAIVVIDEESRIQLWNPKAEAIFGWTSEKIMGMTLVETIIPPAYRSQHLQGVRRMQENGESRVLNRTIEIEALKDSGETIYISLNISRSVRAGRIAFIAFIRDISVEKARELELEEQRNQLAEKNLALERSNEELTAFNYIASHDLKEPVRKIKVFGNLLAASMDETLPALMRDSVNRIITAADHMDRLIEALIVFSRTNTGERIFELIDLELVVSRIKSLLKDRIDESAAVITFGPLPELSGIPFQIQQLFENLIGNALKYSKPDVPPAIHIAASDVSGRDIDDPTADGDAMYHRISVTDNGIGFEQQYATKVFEVFQRLHGKDTYTGTGIGLAICKKIVQQHNGFITAFSNPGQGATFDIYLPLQDE